MAQIADDVAANLKWSRYQDGLTDMRSGLRMAPESFFFPNGKPPPMPEIWHIYRRMKDWNRLWVEGGLSDQPDLLMQMLDACATGEYQYRTVGLKQLLDVENQVNGHQQTSEQVIPYQTL